MMHEGLPKIIMLFIHLNKSTYEYVQGKSWHEGVKVAVSNILPTVGQWMNRNAAPGHLMTVTFFVKLDRDLKKCIVSIWAGFMWFRIGSRRWLL
jgi:hypothetical protein